MTPDELITSNLHLPLKAARYLHAHTFKHNEAIDVQELTSSGWVGLIRAARTYDAVHGASFKTWAYKKIIGAILDDHRIAQQREGYYGRTKERKFSVLRMSNDTFDNICARPVNIERHILVREFFEWLKGKPVRIQRLFNLMRAGMSFAAIARELEVSATRISQLFEATVVQWQTK